MTTKEDLKGLYCNYHEKIWYDGAHVFMHLIGSIFNGSKKKIFLYNNCIVKRMSADCQLLTSCHN